MVITRQIKEKLSSTPAGVVLTTRDFGVEMRYQPALAKALSRLVLQGCIIIVIGLGIILIAIILGKIAEMLLHTSRRIWQRRTTAIKSIEESIRQLLLYLK